MLEDENCFPMVAEQTTSCCCQGNDESAESCSTTQGQGGESLKRSESKEAKIHVACQNFHTINRIISTSQRNPVALTLVISNR